MEKKQGFTLIEMILVMGLVLTLGAMAAPQFTDVFDKSKDKADIAQMDQILAAFQMQQGIAFDSHTGHYDMANPKFIDYQSDEEGKRTAVLQSKAAEKALETFLKDALTSPGSAVYMEGVKSARDGKTPTKDDLIYEVAASSSHVWLTHKITFGADLESSVKVRIPGVSILDEPYLQGDLDNGTWFVIGDDDRLRADYVEDYLKKDDHTEKELTEKLKSNAPYKYRTKFKIVTDMIEKEVELPLGGNLDPDDRWITWLPGGVSSVHKILIKPNRELDELDGVEVEAKFNDGGFVKVPDSGLNITLANNSSGKKALEYVLYRFIKPGEETKYMYYQVSLVQENKLDAFILSNESVGGSIKNNITSSDQDKIPGMIRAKDKSGNPHILYYAFTEKDMPNLDDEGEGSGLTKKIIAPVMDFYTGFILNINQSNGEKKNQTYNQYDFLAFHYNESTESTDLVYYKVHGNGKPSEQSRVALDNFQYNHAYTMELDVRKDKTVVVSLFDGADKLLDNIEMQTDNNALRPAIGFYMNQQVTLKNEYARASEEDHLPLIAYESDGNEGPQLVLLGMPKFYPYQTNEDENDSGSDQPDDGDGGNNDDHPVAGQVKFSYDNQNARITLDSVNNNTMEYVWVYDLNYNGNDPVLASEDKFAGTNNESVGCTQSGWLFARDTIDGVGSGDWYKTPWVNLGSIELVSVEARKETNQKIKYEKPFSLPSGFNWMIQKPNKVKAGTSIVINNAVNMKKVPVQAYVFYGDQQVSATVENSFGYHDFNTHEEVFKVWVKIEQVAGINNRIQVKASEACTINYELIKGNGKIDESGKVEIRQLDEYKIMSAKTNVPSFSIEVVDLNGTVLVEEKTFSNKSNKEYIWNGKSWQ